MSTVGGSGMCRTRIGFACAWWRPRHSTWSYTPISLHRALSAAGANVIDIEAQPPLPLQALAAGALTALGRRPWKYAQSYRAAEGRRIQHATARLRPEVLVEIADLVVPTNVPTYSYQDSNFNVALDYFDALGPDLVSTNRGNRDTLKRLAHAQQEALQRIDGLIAMGRWFADDVVRRGLLPAHKVHAIGAGISPLYQDLPPRTPRERVERKRVLFVGGEFRRKGGEELLAAMRLLNCGGDRPLQLTIAGPAAWPGPGSPPAWVRFLGAVPREAVPTLMAEHDLFAMPSRFEAYGIALLEARAAGLPCVARGEFAMPELVEPGVGGKLWSTADVRDLAQLIQDTLDDDALHERCAREAPQRALQFSWSGVAERLLRIVDPQAASA